VASFPGPGGFVGMGVATAAAMSAETAALQTEQRPPGAGVSLAQLGQIIGTRIMAPNRGPAVP